MKKLKLKFEDLAVDSFNTHKVAGPRGTVEANSGPVSLYSPERTCGDSCLDPNSCAGTCFCTNDVHC